MRRGQNLAALGFAVCFLAGTTAFAEDAGVDQLFEAPPADTEATPGDASQTVSAFHAEPLAISGSLIAEAGGVVGFIDSDGGGYSFDMTPGLSVVPSLTFVSRPDETFRMQGTVTFASLSFAPVVSEMFFDYTLQSKLFFRIGMHTVSWGVTRLFDAGGDLMAGSGSGLDIKANLPIGPGGIMGVVLVPKDLTVFSWRNLTYGAQGDLSLAKSELVLSGTYLDSASSPVRATAVFKTSLLGIDVFAQGVGAWTFGATPALSSLVAGFFWEHPDPDLKLYGEYYFNLADPSLKDHRVALVAGMDKAFGSPFTLGLEWSHAFIDNSGIVIPGISFDLWPHVIMQVGVPCRYGAPGSFYLQNPPPTVATTTSANDILPSWSQRYGIVLRLTLSAGF